MALLARRRSFETRLSALVALAVGVAIAVAALASYLLVDNQLHGQVQHDLQSYYQSLHNFGPNAVGSAAHYAKNNGDRVQQILSNGQIQAYVGEATFKPTATEMAMATGHGPSVLYTDQSIGGVTYRVMTVPLVDDFTGQPAGALQIGRSLYDVDKALANLRLILALVIAGGVALALAIGTFVARATIRPVERLTAAAEHVAATQSLDAVIEEEGDDELGRLAHAFNDMLAALRQSRQQQAQLVSDAGHELRTPLTSLRTNIEFLMRAREMPESDRQELLADVEDQLEELTALVGDIVETSRQDELARVESTEVRLDAIVEHALERARRRAPSLNFDVSLTPGAVRAHPALLERAVLNILDNAAKWSPPGGTVHVTLQRGDTWVLEVRDHGPGIDPEDLPRVFDRFYRAASARSLPGSGLGLAIVQSVVEEHGGAVEATQPPEGGTLVRITLPTVEEVEPSVAFAADPTSWITVPPPPPPPPPDEVWAPQPEMATDRGRPEA